MFGRAPRPPPNAQEITNGTTPWNSDTDGDGLVDGEDEEPLAAAGTQVVFLHPDPLGSPAAVTSLSGQPVRQLRYGSYGELRSNVGATGTPDPAHKYTGKRLDPAVQLADYGARWYDPALAVFTQPDPIVADPFDPQGLNRFAYVGGDPLNFVDPSGHWRLRSSEAPPITRYDTHRFQRDTARMYRDMGRFRNYQRHFERQVARAHAREQRHLLRGSPRQVPRGTRVVRGLQDLKLVRGPGFPPPPPPRGVPTNPVHAAVSALHKSLEGLTSRWNVEVRNRLTDQVRDLFWDVQEGIYGDQDVWAIPSAAVLTTNPALGVIYDPERTQVDVVALPRGSPRPTGPPEDDLHASGNWVHFEAILIPRLRRSTEESGE